MQAQPFIKNNLFKKYIIMEEQIKNWYRNHHHHHDLDDQCFYGIVIASVGEKIDYDVFDTALREVAHDITEDEVSSIYLRYEDLRSLLVYYLEKNAQNE